MRGEGVESFEEVVFGSIEHAEVVEGAAAAEVLRGEGYAETGGGENLVGGSHGGGMEVVVEGVGPEEDFGGFGWKRDAAVTVAACVAGGAHTLNGGGVTRVASSSSCARLSRWLVSHWCGVVPVREANQRANVRGAMWIRAASWATVIGSAR